MQAIHHTRGLYPSGDYKDNGVRAEDLDHHVWYNKTYRPGRALFVNGVCVYQGNVQPEVCREMESRLLAAPKVYDYPSDVYW